MDQGTPSRPLLGGRIAADDHRSARLSLDFAKGGSLRRGALGGASRPLVYLDDGGQMAIGKSAGAAEHGERDFPGCGLALKPAFLDLQNLGSLGGRVQRR